jgi:uncharacterized SAM-binding protein YcdF (DUF218 family)
MAQTCDAAIVLGCRINETTRARALEAAQAFSNGICDQLVLVGTSDEADCMLRLALEANVPDDKIVVSAGSYNTLENAYHAKHIVQILGLRKVCLVTSRIHMKRALAIFRHIFGNGFEICPLDVDDNPRRADILKEDLLTRLLPLLTLFKEGDTELVTRVVTSVHKVYRKSVIRNR